MSNERSCMPMVIPGHAIKVNPLHFPDPLHSSKNNFKKVSCKHVGGSTNQTAGPTAYRLLSTLSVNHTKLE